MSREDWIIAETGMNTFELLQRIRRSTVDGATLDALTLTIDQLCCDYPFAEPQALITASRDWPDRITRLLNERLTLAQHRDLLTQAGQLALLIGCLEYDLGDARAAEATRTAALQLGLEADNSHIGGIHLTGVV
jgi:hypothetical protein